VNEKKLSSKPITLKASNDEEERDKIVNLWEKTKPFDECKESLRRYILKRVDIQVKEVTVQYSTVPKVV
jgi:hypothetical protein